jgi:hypothetical protein
MTGDNYWSFYMPEFYGSAEIETIPVVTHKVGELVSLLVNGAYKESPKLNIRNVSNGYYFNKQTRSFEEFSQISDNGNLYTFTFGALYDTGLYSLNISTLPPERQTLLFTYKAPSFTDEGGVASSDAIDEMSAEFVSGPFTIVNSGTYEIEFSLTGGNKDTVFAEVTVNGEDYDNTSVSVPPPGNTRTFRFQLDRLLVGDVVEIKAWSVPIDEPGFESVNQPDVSNVTLYRLSYEKHVFGLPNSASQPQICTVYGTLLDVSGKPLVGQKVDVYLNRAGYFTHKSGLVGYAATTISDESGYWEIPIIVGLDVTISVPIIGFSQSGFVPPLSSVELTPETLLKYRPN